MARWRVDDGATGLRVETFVARRTPGLSVAAARRALADGRVRVDGRRARKGLTLAAGQIVDADDEALTSAPVGVSPEADMPLSVLYLDEFLVAVDKPAGVPSHPLRADEHGTAAGALVARFPECAAAGEDAREGGLGHRLDRGTSGVLLAARTRAAWKALRAALASGSCEKSYLAEVRGVAPAHASSDAAIGRAGRRGARVVVGGGRGALPAHTAFELVEARGTTSLVRARLSVGRAHQVRAHLASLGHPVVGDDRYGPQPPSGPLRLHAESVRIVHPVTGAPLVIAAPPPAWAVTRSR